MSKRVTLSNREIQCIVSGLKMLKEETRLDYEVIKTGRQVYQDIIDKLTTPKEKYFKEDPTDNKGTKG